MSVDATAHTLAPRARIQRDTRAQRAFAPVAEAHLRALLAGARGHGPALVQERLDALRDALWRSPGHRARLEVRGLSPNDLRSLDDLPHFPLLSRGELAALWDALPLADAGELFVARSSGTTGEPVQVVRGGYDNLHMWTVLQFWLRHLGLGLPRRPRVVLLDALPGGLEYSVRVPLLDDGALHRISTSRPDAVERLRRVKPSVIFSDPAGLHWLAGQEDAPRPQLLLSSAQRLAPALRIQLRAPVLDYYATTETGPIAWACLQEPSRFHVLAPDVHVESVDGELAVTRLRESPLPLLRYLPGDRGEVQQLRCPCGFAGPSIVNLDGRRSCSFVRPDGARVDAWSLAWIFKHHPLRAFRLTQRAISDFALELDAPQVDPALLARLTDALRALGWPDPQLDATRRASASSAKHEPFVGLR